MTFLYADLSHIPAIKQAILQHRLGEVRIAPPFLGRVVVQCPDEPVAQTLKSAVPGLH